MPLEIERKFLVIGEAWKALAEPVVIRQGYLARGDNCVVRVRTADGMAWLTVKSPTKDFTRHEYEVEIPFAEAVEMLDLLCLKPIIEKRRYRITTGGLTWEVDEFMGENAGLVVAEVELGRADQSIIPPDWIGAEVTGDLRYYNSNLLVNPFQKWSR